MIRVQQILAHWLWAISRKLDSWAKALFHTPFSPHRITCEACRKTVTTLRVRELHYGPYGYKPVCRQCYDAIPF